MSDPQHPTPPEHAAATPAPPPATSGVAAATMPPHPDTWRPAAVPSPWPAPPSRPLRAAGPGWLAAAAAVGALGGSVLVPRPWSLAFPLVAAAALAVIVVAARAGGTRGEALWTSSALAGAAMALAVVPAVSVSPGPVVLAVLASGGLACAALAPPPTWPALIVLPGSLLVRALQALPWVGCGLADLVARIRRPRVATPAEEARPPRRGSATGIAVTALIVVVVGSLLVSADAGLSWAADALVARLGGLVPDLTLPAVTGRVVLAAVLALAVLVAVHARLAGAPPMPPLPAARARRATWLPPLVALAVLIGGFLVVQGLHASGLDVVAAAGGPAYRERVHQGFGQLVVVTVIVVVVLAWAARGCDRDDAGARRSLAAAGAPVVAFTIGLAGVALARVQAYSDLFGFTRLRLLVSGFEVWVAVLLVLIAAAWFGPVARRLPVLVLASLGLAVGGLCLSAGDGDVAEYNLDRLARTGRIDLDYLTRMSADAVPALDRLPSHLRECALTAWLEDQPAGWADSAAPGVGWNRAVDRAADVLREPVSAPADCSDVLNDKERWSD